jgi:protein required for attachment to host cells
MDMIRQGWSMSLFQARLDGVDFTARVAAALEDMVRRRGVPALVIVAPPRTLADLRTAFHADVKKRIVAEVGKDLTKHPVADIEKHLFARRA